MNKVPDGFKVESAWQGQEVKSQVLEQGVSMSGLLHDGSF